MTDGCRVTGAALRAAPRAVVACLALVALVALCGACGSRPATRVLFIGNSFTSYNGGLDTLLAGLAPTCTTASFDQGGFTLEEHWNDAAELHSIATGHWDYVVLQDQSQSPVVNVAEFRRYTLLFDHAIARSGAKTVLLMTWNRPDSAAEGVTTANLSAAYRAAGRPGRQGRSGRRGVRQRPARTPRHRAQQRRRAPDGPRVVPRGLRRLPDDLRPQHRRHHLFRSGRLRRAAHVPAEGRRRKPRQALTTASRRPESLRRDRTRAHRRRTRMTRPRPRKKTKAERQRLGAAHEHGGGASPTTVSARCAPTSKNGRRPRRRRARAVRPEAREAGDHDTRGRWWTQTVTRRPRRRRPPA